MIHQEILQQDADILCLQVGSKNLTLAVAMTYVALTSRKSIA